MTLPPRLDHVGPGFLVGHARGGRTHYIGERINEQLDQLEVEVLITGDDRKAGEIGRQLKTPMMRAHKPVWNAPNPPFTGKG